MARCDHSHEQPPPHVFIVGTSLGGVSVTLRAADGQACPALRETQILTLKLTRGDDILVV